MKLVNTNVTLLSITPNANKLIERAARTCYQSFDKVSEGSANKLIASCISRGHESILEHASASFSLITNRGVSHELVRHRLASYSQESTRYCKYNKSDMEFIDPRESFVIDDNLYNKFCDSFVYIEKMYNDMISVGAKAELARGILTNYLKTEVIMTANFREWRHFIELRTSNKAHPEMITLAIKIMNVLKEQCPIVFDEIV